MSVPVIVAAGSDSATAADVGAMFGSKTDSPGDAADEAGVAGVGARERNLMLRPNWRTNARKLRANCENTCFATLRTASCSAVEGGETSGDSGCGGDSECSETASVGFGSTSLLKVSRCSISPQTEHLNVSRLNPET